MAKSSSGFCKVGPKTQLARFIIAQGFTSESFATLCGAHVISVDRWRNGARVSPVYLRQLREKFGKRLPINRDGTQRLIAVGKAAPLAA